VRKRSRVGSLEEVNIYNSAQSLNWSCRWIGLHHLEKMEAYIFLDRRLDRIVLHGVIAWIRFRHWKSYLED